MKTENSKAKILLVEDDKFISEIYKRKLEESDFEVKLAEDGVDAIISFSNFKPQVVLLDVMLPKKSGWDVLKEIREMDKNNDVRVVMLTNVEERDKIQQSLKMGADDYLVKSSLTPSELIEVIKNKL